MVFPRKRNVNLKTCPKLRISRLLPSRVIKQWISLWSVLYIPGVALFSHHTELRASLYLCMNWQFISRRIGGLLCQFVLGRKETVSCLVPILPSTTIILNLTLRQNIKHKWASCTWTENDSFYQDSNCCPFLLTSFSCLSSQPVFAKRDD